MMHTIRPPLDSTNLLTLLFTQTLYLAGSVALQPSHLLLLMEHETCFVISIEQRQVSICSNNGSKGPALFSRSRTNKQTTGSTTFLTSVSAGTIAVMGYIERTEQTLQAQQH